MHSNIKIIIENNDNKYINEEEKIINSARILFENGYGESIEECIHLIAVNIRGLKYKSSKIDEEGNTILIFDASPKSKKENDLSYKNLGYEKMSLERAKEIMVGTWARYVELITENLDMPKMISAQELRDIKEKKIIK